MGISKKQLALKKKDSLKDAKKTQSLQEGGVIRIKGDNTWEYAKEGDVYKTRKVGSDQWITLRKDKLGANYDVAISRINDAMGSSEGVSSKQKEAETKKKQELEFVIQEAQRSPQTFTAEDFKRVDANGIFGVKLKANEFLSLEIPTNRGKMPVHVAIAMQIDPSLSFLMKSGKEYAESFDTEILWPAMNKVQESLAPEKFSEIERSVANGNYRALFEALQGVNKQASDARVGYVPNKYQGMSGGEAKQYGIYGIPPRRELEGSKKKRFMSNIPGFYGQ